MVDILAKVRITSSSWDPGTFTRNGIYYSTQLSIDKADAIFGLYDPMQELLDFDGPKLWFTLEPQWHSFWNKGIGKQLLKRLKSDEIAYYAHPDPKYRIPHMTTLDSFTYVRNNTPRSKTAVAVVSNYGGRLYFLKRFIKLRNQFILSPLVELYGKSDSWNKFRHFPKLWKVRVPMNYHGDLPNAFQESHLKFISTYKVCICIENSCEPYYFTEKFVNAVRSGCIPIYHAHPTVRNYFLKNALWVDPSDFNFNVEKTINYALEQDINKYQTTNDAWLDSSETLAMTTPDAFWEQICMIFEEKLGIQK